MNQQNSKAILHGIKDISLIKDECLHEIFENVVDRYPENAAIIFQGNTFTYKDIDQYSNRLARHLINKGVKKGDCVGILLKKSVETFVSILGIMKAGAAYVAIDISFPVERAKFIISDSGIKYVLSNTEYAELFDVKHQSILFDREKETIQQLSPERISRLQTGVTRNDLSYIIYTSGTTGNPKGVAIEHKSVCNLVRASQTIYRILPTDRVYQGFIISFDASIEEIWMAFGHGAALVPATDEMQQAGPNLFKMLADLNVTVISCVPTLLGIMDENIPSLRLLIVGGENCPTQLAERWAVEGRRLVNTYGPTEATVIATGCEYQHGKKLTIGIPIPNYSVYIIKDNGELALTGEEGELMIGGIGLARGYVNKESLTKEKFIANPFKENAEDPDMLYHSGDLALINEDGEIDILGRIDDQVKIRGFRIELNEIESLFNTYEEVKTCVVSVVNEPTGLKSLAVYLLPKDNKDAIDTEKLLKLAKEKLPPYMIPKYIEILEEIPMLPSGKVNKKMLPAPTSSIRISRGNLKPRNEMETMIYNVWKEVFNIDELSINDHFFNDLGGHSLIAAQTVSKLRNFTEAETVNFSDIYESPTIELLAKKLDAEKGKNTFKSDAKVRESSFLKSSSIKHVLCGFGQLIAMFLIFAVLSIPLVAIFYSFYSDTLDITEIEDIFGILIVVMMGYLPFLMLLSVVIKWTVIGKFKAGKYPLWGSYFLRWWIVRQMQSLFPVFLFSGTPLMAFYLRLMGAKIGKDCFIGTQHIKTFDLFKAGDEANIGHDAQLLGYIVEDGYLILGAIEVGSRCYIGTHSVMSNNTKMEAGAMLLEQSMISPQVVIPSGETWAGSPAAKTQPDDDILKLQQNPYKSSKSRRAFFGVAYFFAMYIFELAPIIAMLPVSMLMYFLYYDYNHWSFLFAPFAAIAFIVILCLEMWILKKLLLGKIKPGIYSIYSSFYLRKWIVDQMMYMSLTVLHTLYATLLTPVFLKIMGVKIGKRVEVSTLTHISPDLLEIGDESFFADASMAGTPKIYMEKTQIAKSKIGKRTFIGNSALLPINRNVGDNCLIGVLSITPQKKETESGTSWLGSPAIFLPKRDINTDFPVSETYSPSRKLYLKRFSIEFIRIILPITLSFIIFIFDLIILGYMDLYLYFSEMVLLFPLLLAVTLIGSTLLVALIKKIVIGKYVPLVRPLWSTFVWRTELVTGVYEAVAVTSLLGLLQGTPFLVWFLRLFGCKIGKRVFIDSTFLSEFDLVNIGDDVAINFHTTMQSHLFEDRVMKMSYINVGDNCSVGCGSIVLYDTELKEGAKMGNLSLLMKGETLPAWSSWEGNPVQRTEK